MASRSRPASRRSHPGAAAAADFAGCDVVVLILPTSDIVYRVVLGEDGVLAQLKAGSVIVDMAAPAGGNCPLTEAGRTVVKHGVTIVGHATLAAMVATAREALARYGAERQTATAPV